MNNAIFLTLLVLLCVESMVLVAVQKEPHPGPQRLVGGAVDSLRGEQVTQSMENSLRRMVWDPGGQQTMLTDDAYSKAV